MLERGIIMKYNLKQILIVGGLSVVLVLWAIIGSTTQQPMRLVCDIWPPYQVESNGVVTGYSAELVQAVYEKMGVPIEKITAYPWKRALSIMEHGRADALFSANYTDERRLFARYPEEVLAESPWIIWSRGKKAIQSLDDLKGKRIGVVIGYSYTRQFWDFIETYCIVEKVTSDEINFKKLNFGRLDATVAEYGNGLHLIKEFGLHSIKAQPAAEIKRDGLYIMFNRDNISDSFVQDFSKELKRFKTTAEHTKLREKYFGKESDS